MKEKRNHAVCLMGFAAVLLFACACGGLSLEEGMLIVSPAAVTEPLGTPTPEPTASVSVTPEPTTSVPTTPDTKPTASVSTTPTLTASASTTPVPTEPPEPTAILTPTPEATTAPPEPTAILTPTPEATTAPPEPTATLNPTPEATFTPEPTATLTPSPEATAAPPVPTPEPTKAVASPVPTPPASPTPTSEASPEASPTPSEGPEQPDVPLPLPTINPLPFVHAGWQNVLDIAMDHYIVFPECFDNSSIEQENTAIAFLYTSSTEEQIAFSIIYHIGQTYEAAAEEILMRGGVVEEHLPEERSFSYLMEEDGMAFCGLVMEEHYNEELLGEEYENKEIPGTMRIVFSYPISVRERYETEEFRYYIVRIE